MIFNPMLLFGMATATTTSIEPTWLAAASKNYETCIFAAIDRQYETGRFSEKAVLSECARVRRAQVRAAELAAVRSADEKNGEAQIGREFARVDQSVWTIVSHLRERRGKMRNGS